MPDPEALVPLMAGVVGEDRLRGLALAAVDRFVLSLVDGQTSIRELAQTVGISSDEVIASLIKLESLRVVVLPSSGSSAGSTQSVRRSTSPQPIVVPGASGAAVADGEIELEPEHQRQIDDLFGRLESLDHYAVLGVPRTSDKKAIKRAYFERTSRFHPDRFFRKRLGPFKMKMETVFGRMTEAHDTLTTNEKRAEYDAYLASVMKTRSIEEMLAEALNEVRRAEEATLSATVSSLPPPPPPSSSPQLSVHPSAASAPQRTSVPDLRAAAQAAAEGQPQSRPPPANKISAVVPNDPKEAQARREMFARRLTAGSMRPMPTAPKVPTIAYTKTEDAVDALKRRYQEKVAAARTSQARKYTSAGLDARAKGDMVAAANALRVAITFDTENAELKAAYEDSQKAADGILVEQYLKQAEYEERSERWADAGRSWTRVARVRTTDARAHERGAHCLLKADGNLREAVPLGQKAVQLEPKNVSYRVTMANVYLAAGLTLNAKRELEAAVQLAPDDPAVATLLKRIGKAS